MKYQSFSLVPFVRNDLTSHLKIDGWIKRVSGSVFIHYQLAGKLSEILLPEQSDMPTRKNRLWNHTCFEFFVAVKDLPHYWEFNLAPSGDWNVFHFRDYRDGMKEELTFTSLPFKIQPQSEAFQLELACDLDRIINDSNLLEVAVSAVVEGRNGAVSYWALTHAGLKPDFHRRDSFTLDL